MLKHQSEAVPQSKNDIITFSPDRKLQQILYHYTLKKATPLDTKEIPAEKRNNTAHNTPQRHTGIKKTNSIVLKW